MISHNRKYNRKENEIQAKIKKINAKKIREPKIRRLLDKHAIIFS